MNYVFSKSSLGYLHKRDALPCQDNSLSFHDEERTIITCCDGHGGKIYVRSKIGSKFASQAILNIFKKVTKKDTKHFHDNKFLEKIKLAILCEWNRLVEADLSINRLKKKELEKLNENELEILKNNKVKAYGTTLSGAMLINGFLLVISIGDSECFTIKNGKVNKVFSDENDPVGNITYSMCQEDAFNYLRIKVLLFKDIDALILGTDGLTSPYQSYSNFIDSFLHPLMKKVVIDKDFDYINDFIDKLASQIGVGDDVSLSYIIDSKSFKKYYL